jgi:hypothetical protein
MAVFGVDQAVRVQRPKRMQICHTSGVRWTRRDASVVAAAPAQWQTLCIRQRVLPSLRHAVISTNGIGPSS